MSDENKEWLKARLKEADPEFLNKIKSFKEYYKGLEYRIIALEKKYKLQTIANGKLIEQIAELKYGLKMYSETQSRINDTQGNIIEQIAKIKEKLNEVAQSRIGWEENIEKVLRDHINEHFRIADADRDDLNVILSWKGKLILQLEKLDVGSARQTEKKEKLPEPIMGKKCLDCDGYNPKEYASECEDMYHGNLLRCETEPEKEG